VTAPPATSTTATTGTSVTPTNEPDGGEVNLSTNLSDVVEHDAVALESCTVADPSIVSQLPVPSKPTGTGQNLVLPSVNMKVIGKDQEAAIGFRFDPISMLVRDSTWRSAMEKALQNDYVKFLSETGALVQTSK